MPMMGWAGSKRARKQNECQGRHSFLNQPEVEKRKRGGKRKKRKNSYLERVKGD